MFVHIFVHADRNRIPPPPHMSRVFGSKQMFFIFLIPGLGGQLFKI